MQRLQHLVSARAVCSPGDICQCLEKFLIVIKAGWAVTNLDSVLKSKDITLPTKVRIVKAVVFLVVLYRLDPKEGRAPKN